MAFSECQRWSFDVFVFRYSWFLIYEFNEVVLCSKDNKKVVTMVVGNEFDP